LIKTNGQTRWHGVQNITFNGMEGVRRKEIQFTADSTYIKVITRTQKLETK